MISIGLIAHIKLSCSDQFMLVKPTISYDAKTKQMVLRFRVDPKKGRSGHDEQLRGTPMNEHDQRHEMYSNKLHSAGAFVNQVNMEARAQAERDMLMNAAVPCDTSVRDVTKLEAMLASLEANQHETLAMLDHLEHKLRPFLHQGLAQASGKERSQDKLHDVPLLESIENLRCMQGAINERINGLIGRVTD